MQYQSRFFTGMYVAFVSEGVKLGSECPWTIREGGKYLDAIARMCIKMYSHFNDEGVGVFAIANVKNGKSINRREFIKAGGTLITNFL